MNLRKGTFENLEEFNQLISDQKSLYGIFVNPITVVHNSDDLNYIIFYTETKV